MYETITQPFITLANANMAAFSRLTDSPELPNILKMNTETYLQQTKGFLAHATKSEALAEWTKTLMSNHATFVNELTHGFFGALGQGKAFVAEQTEELSKNIQQGFDNVVHAQESSVDALNAEYDAAVVPLETAKPKRKAA